MKGWWSVTSVNHLSLQNIWNRFTPYTIYNASLSMSVCTCAVFVKNCDAKANGLSLPSGMTYERTPLMPVGESGKHHMQA